MTMTILTILILAVIGWTIGYSFAGSLCFTVLGLFGLSVLWFVVVMAISLWPRKQ